MSATSKEFEIEVDRAVCLLPGSWKREDGIDPYVKAYRAKSAVLQVSLDARGSRELHVGLRRAMPPVIPLDAEEILGGTRCPDTELRRISDLMLDADAPLNYRLEAVFGALVAYAKPFLLGRAWAYMRAWAKVYAEAIRMHVQESRESQ